MSKKKYNPELDLKQLDPPQLDDNKYKQWFKKRHKKWKKERIRRGFCGRDIWNLDNFLIHIISDTLDYHVKTHCGTPQGWSKEDYDEYLTNIARDLREANELTNIGHEVTDIEKANSLLRSAFMRLSNVFWSLWD